MKLEEKFVINKLVEAHNEFVKLPLQHPDDLKEWILKLHDLQRIVMARTAVDRHPDYFYTLKSDGNKEH